MTPVRMYAQLKAEAGSHPRQLSMKLARAEEPREEVTGGDSKHTVQSGRHSKEGA